MLTQLSTTNLVKDGNYNYLITARDDPTTSTLVFTQLDGPDTATVAGKLHDMTAGNLIGPFGFRDSTVPVMTPFLNRFSVREVGDIDIFVSRDNGTTYTQATIIHGENNVDVDVSSQPAGTELLIKAVVQHPARLYGWGASWTADV